MIIIDIADEIDLQPEKPAVQKAMPEPWQEHVGYDNRFILARWHHRQLLKIGHIARLLRYAHSKSGGG